MKLKLLCLIALAWASQASAVTVTITITGTVYSGTDGSYNSRTGQYQYTVFGGGGDLTGKSFTLTFTVPDSGGTQSGATCSGVLGQSGITGSASGAMTGTLSIGGSFNYGLYPASVSWSSKRYGAGCYTSSISNVFSESYTGGTYTGNSSISGSAYPTATLTNADWRTNVSSVSATGSINFAINLSTGGTPTSYASGTLTVSNVYVTGIPATINIPIAETTAPGSTGTHDESGGVNGGSDTNGWDDNGIFNTYTNKALGAWTQTLKALDGGTNEFTGTSNVQETDAGNASDTCWYSGSAVPQVTGLPSGGTWDVQSGDVWGYDFVGWTVSVYGDTVAYYRGTAGFNGQPAGSNRAPCGATVHQQMSFKASNGTWYNYGTVNTLTGQIVDGSHVSSSRAGSSETRNY